MLDQVLAPLIVKAGRKPLHHADRPIGRPQQQRPASEVIAPPSNAATTSRPG
jgi:hypothetical protein